MSENFGAGIPLDEDATRHSMTKEQERRRCVLRDDRLEGLSLPLIFLIEDDVTSLQPMVSTFQDEVTIDLDAHYEIQS